MATKGTHSTTIETDDGKLIEVDIEYAVHAGSPPSWHDPGDDTEVEILDTKITGGIFHDVEAELLKDEVEAYFENEDNFLSLQEEILDYLAEKEEQRSVEVILLEREDY